MNRRSVNQIKIVVGVGPISLLKWDFSSSSLQTIQSSKPSVSPFYNLLPPTQNPHNIVDMICSSLANKTPLSHLQNDLQSIIHHLGPPEISRVLLRCQSDHFSALGFFNWVRADLGVRPSTRNYCHAVHILACSLRFVQAAALLSELIEAAKCGPPGEGVFESLVACTRDCNWSKAAFDMLIRTYVMKGMIREAFYTFGKTVGFGLLPDVTCCNFLLNAMARKEYVAQCLAVFDAMIRIGVDPDRHTCNTLIHLLCKCGDVRKVNAFMEKMEDMGFDPDVVTYNILISSYCRNGRLGDAVFLYNIMPVRNVAPDLVTHTALINGFCRHGRVKEAHQIFQRIVQCGLVPDVVVYNTLIKGYCDEDKMEESRSLFDCMIEDGICPNNFTCGLLIRGYQRTGKLNSAVDFVAEMKRLGVRVSSRDYNFLMVALCRENHPFAAKSLWQRIFEDGFTPSVVLYSEMIQSFCRCDFGSEALLVKENMLRMNFKPNLILYKALMECVCRIGRSVEGEWLMREMMEIGFSPDSEICRTLVSGYCRENDLDKAESLLIMFSRDFRICDSESYNALVKVISETGDVSRCLDLQSRLQKSGFIPNRLTCKYIISGLQIRKQSNMYLLNE